ncbi:MAG: shikimate kinase [Muribaculaceae bacterium]|nr:shikimate kinase [Muribaculaceae bacterium]
MSPIFLIGYMGSGKTTLGRGVEARTHIKFIDLDQYIEERYGKSISAIFREYGEDGFRKIERDTVRELASEKDILVACGGGTPCFFDNMDVMNRCGVTVWLDASVDILHARLKEGRSQRPLIAGLDDDELKDFIIASLEKRTPFYNRASHRFIADNLDTATDLDASIDSFIKEFLPG